MKVSQIKQKLCLLFTKDQLAHIKGHYGLDLRKKEDLMFAYALGVTEETEAKHDVIRGFVFVRGALVFIVHELSGGELWAYYLQDKPPRKPVKLLSPLSDLYRYCRLVRYGEAFRYVDIVETESKT